METKKIVRGILFQISSKQSVFRVYPPQAYRAINVHIPKLNKFKLKDNLVMLYQPFKKWEVIAA